MKRLRMMKAYLVFTLILGVFILSGCAGESGNGHWDKPPSPLASITVTPVAPSIPIAGFQQFKAEATYEDGTTLDVTTSSSWISATTAVATVTPTTGVAIGVTSGTSDISATFNGKSDTVTLTVNAATLMSLVVTPVPASIPVGGTQKFTARAIYSDGYSVIVTEAPTTVWTAVNVPLDGAAIATLSANGVLGAGLATGNTPGTSDITAAFGGMTDTVTLTVNDATLVSIVVTPDSAAIPVNGSQKFTAMANYSYGLPVNVTEDAGTVWTATNVPVVGAAVATLSPNGVLGAGLATGQVAGTATITATFGTLSDSATLTVNDATLVSITVSPDLGSIPVDGTQNFTAIATYSFGPPVDVTEDPATIWTAVNTLVGPAVATLSPNGVLGAGLATGKVAGTSTITATFGTQSDTAILTVIPATLVSILVTPELASIPVNGTQQYIALATYSYGPPVDVTEDPATVWTAVNVDPLIVTAVATLSPNGVLGAGLATGQLEGNSTITATFGTQYDTATLEVTPAPTIIPGALCTVDAGPTIPTVTQSDPSSDNQFASTSTINVLNNGKLITATFSLEMDPTTIESATAPLTFTIKETVSGNNVPGAVTMDAANKVATFTTEAALLEDTRYTASITTAATSAGVPPTAIACPYEWDFKTIIPAEVGVSPVDLGAAASFGVASTAGLVNVGATTVNGDIVLDPDFTCNNEDVGSAGLIGPCNGFAPTVNGTVISQHYPDPGVTSGAVIADLRAAYISLSPAQMSTGVVNIPDGTTLGAGVGTALVEHDNLFFPGIYQSLSSILITGDLTLDASGNPDALFVFQSSSSIGTAATGEANPHTRILLVNGAKASNVFWWVGSNQATLGTYTQFQGNLLSYSSITMETGATSCGRLFAGASTDGAFVFGENVVSVPGHPMAPAGCK